MKIIFLDTETTTGDLSIARLIQLAYRIPPNEPINELFRSTEPITYEASAVHHITNTMVENKPLFYEAETYQRLKDLLNEHVLIAHNAKFDIQILNNEGITVPRHICTLKLARRYLRLDQMGQSLSGYSMQYLRYAIKGLDIDGAVAHDAAGDIAVLEKLFDHLKSYVAEDLGTFDEAAILERMVQISTEPSLLTRIGFGKYRGQSFDTIDTSYLTWLIGQSDLDEDLVYTIKYTLRLREGTIGI